MSARHVLNLEEPDQRGAADFCKAANKPRLDSDGGLVATLSWNKGCQVRAQILDVEGV